MTEAEFDAMYDAMLDAMTDEQIEVRDRLQEAQIIVVEKAKPWGEEELLHVFAATQMAMRNDMDAPVEQIAADALLILGVTP